MSQGLIAKALQLSPHTQSSVIHTTLPILSET